MIQPTDPPPRAEPVEPAALQPAPEPRPQPVVVLHAPRPMYECVRDDGSRYTSDDGEGNPRWISSRSEEHTSELQSLMRNSYAVFCLRKKTADHSNTKQQTKTNKHTNKTH